MEHVPASRVRLVRHVTHVPMVSGRAQMGHARNVRMEQWLHATTEALAQLTAPAPAMLGLSVKHASSPAQRMLPALSAPASAGATHSTVHASAPPPIVALLVRSCAPHMVARYAMVMAAARMVPASVPRGSMARLAK